MCDASCSIYVMDFLSWRRQTCFLSICHLGHHHHNLSTLVMSSIRVSLWTVWVLLQPLPIPKSTWTPQSPWHALLSASHPSSPECHGSVSEWPQMQCRDLYFQFENATHLIRSLRSKGTNWRVELQWGSRLVPGHGRMSGDCGWPCYECYHWCWWSRKIPAHKMWMFEIRTGDIPVISRGIPKRTDQHLST